MDINKLPFIASQEMILAVRATEAAAQEIIPIYNSNFAVNIKSDGAPVTEADLISDKIIRQILGMSGLPVLSEETADTPERLYQNRVWVVDPLDGTKDFANRTGEFTILIGLVVKGEPELGVVLQPAINNLYIAERGKGAFSSSDGKTWKRLRVSEISDIKRARIVVSQNHLSESEKRFLDDLNKNNYRQCGSSGLKIVQVAANLADCYFTFTDKIKQWDVAAGHSILLEAGGKISSMLGEEITYNSPEVFFEHGILVTNGHLHPTLLKHYESTLSV